MTPSSAATESAQVRSQLVTSLELELIGPTPRVLKSLAADGEGLEREALDRLPSSWYITGFLVPTTTDLSLRCDDTADDDLAGVDGVDQRRPRSKDKAYKPGGAGDDGGPSDAGPAKPQFLPSSIGISVFLPPAGELELIARWGDYTRLPEAPSPDPSSGGGSRREEQIWQRTPRHESLVLSHSVITGTHGLGDLDWPNSGGLHLRWHCRPAPLNQGYGPGTVAVSLFLTNERPKTTTLVERDQYSAFQAELDLRCPQGFVARRDPQARRQDGDWDQLVHALQYRDASEYGVGHNVGVEVDLEVDGGCTRLRTTWIPKSVVEKVSPREDVGCELRMEELDRRAGEGFAAVRGALMPLVERYEAWIQEQAGQPGGSAPHPADDGRAAARQRQQPGQTDRAGHRGPRGTRYP
jgi:hypothetical protein